MLKPDPSKSCIECGKLLHAAGFARDEEGPLYWCEDGFVCSPRCAANLVRRREADGKPVKLPAERPRNLRKP